MEPAFSQSALIAEITTAFQNELYPGDTHIVHDNVGFHLEYIEIRDAFKGHSWQEVTNDVLSAKRTGLSFMSKEGFKYYLPAFMCSLLRDTSVVDDGIITVVQLLKLPTEIDVTVVAEIIQGYDVASKMPDVDLNEVLHNQLTHTNKSVNTFIARAIQFTPAQGRAIYRFLVYARDAYGDEMLSVEAGLAIVRYWFQFA